MALLLVCVGGTTAYAQTWGATGNTTLTVNVAAEAAISITTGSTALDSTPGLFVDYAGRTDFLYKIRTGASAGSAGITLQITSDFNGTGGPSVATPPSAGDSLTYTCTVASSANACTGTQTASTGSPTPVATFNADAHSMKAGDAGSVSWKLTNDPKYKVGSYSATATFTISAT